MPLVRMKAAPVKTDGERLGNEFLNGVFFSAHMKMTILLTRCLMEFMFVWGEGVQGVRGIE